MNKKDKVIIVPGWMDRSHYHCKWKDLNVWGRNINLDRKIKEEFIVGHCAGAPVALSIWEKNKDKKIILVNPLFPKRGVMSWIKRFLRFSGNEPLLNPIARIPMFLKIFTGGFNKFIKAARVDSLKIIKKIPKEKIFIIYGENDNYFFDKEARNIAKEMNIRMIKIKKAGHNWSNKFNKAIKEILSYDK